MARRPWAGIVAAYLAIVAVMAVVGGLAGGEGDTARRVVERLRPPPPRAALPLETRSPQVVGVASNVRVLIALRRPALGDLTAEARGDAAAQRAYVRSLRREVGALRSALEARGVRFGRPVGYARVWAGFAATVSTRDLAAVRAAGLRVEPVRRFYPAAAPGPAPFRAGARGRAGVLAAGVRLRRTPTVALLDSGVDRSHPALRGRVRAIFDAVGPARLPRGRRDVHGTAVAGLLARDLPARARLLAIRVAGLQPRAEGGGFEEWGTTDQLLAGMERAVDPDGDGDADDAAAVALVGVVSPYAGFHRSPEAEAVRAGARLGTLTVAPVGNQGPAAGAFGTVGSPAAAPAAVGVGALAGPVAVPQATFTVTARGGRTAVAGELLGGPARAVDGQMTAVRRRARGRILVATGDPGVAAERALAAGARALVVVSRDGRRPAAPPPGAAGGLPVVALGGPGAAAVLALARTGEGLAAIRPGTAGTRIEPARPAPESAAGPTFGLAPKPDLLAPGSAVAPAADGRSGYFAGGSVAAAAVAARAALLRAARPDLDAETAAAVLVGSATAAGAGRPAAALRRAVKAPLAALPPRLSIPAGGSAAVRLRNLGPRRLRLELGAGRLGRVRRLVIPAGRSRALRVRAPRRARRGAVSLRVRRAGRVLISVPAWVHRPPPRARIGRARLLRENGRVIGVRFPAGRVRRAGRRLAVEPVGTLVLRLAGPATRELTPPGGARDLLPGAYAYTLADEVVEGLPAGRYRFEIRARGPADGRAAGVRSPSFSLP